MGDLYKVYRNAKGLWCSSITYKDSRGIRVCCTGSSFLWVARDIYFEDIKEAQEDALAGCNPYISKAYALAYRDADFV